MVKTDQSRTPSGPRGRGFTLTEMMFTVAVIFLLMGLLVVGLRIASRTANKAAEQHAIAALIMGCEQFKTDFGFPPPLIEDNNGAPDFVGPSVDKRVGPLYPLNGAPSDPVAFLSTTDHAMRFDREERYLRGRDQMNDSKRLVADYRFSTYSLAYYLLGVLGKDSTGEKIDGVDGAGFLQPNADGTFRKTGGKKYEPLFDTSKGTKGVVPVDAAAGKFELRDRRGVPYRYYMWRHGRQDPPGNPGNLVVQKSDDLNVPRLLGDPEQNAALRNAEYAIVGAGINGIFGDYWVDANIGNGGTETPTDIKNALGVSQGMDDARAAGLGREDNVVGVGR